MRAGLVLVIAACNVPDRPVMPVPARSAVAAQVTSDADPIADAPAIWARNVLVSRDHLCALRPDGHAMCWGANYYGEVGDVPRVPHEVPIVVPNVEHAIAIGAGPASTCVVVADGRVRCWGSYEAKLAAARDIAGVDGAVEVAATSSKGCARRRDGAVWCWSSVELGKAERVDELGVARRIVAGNDFVCAIGTDANVRCMVWWSGANQKPTFSELEIRDADGAIAISAFFQTACAVLRDGSVTCWTLEGGPPKLSVSKVIGLTDAVDIVAGLSETCVAQRGGGVACFPTSARGDLESKPRGELRGFRALAFASSVRCGLRGAALLCWGEDHGPLGRYVTRGVQATPVEIAGITDAAELAIETESACVRTTGGGVTCWSRSSGPATPIAIKRADHVVAGRFFSCAIIAGKPSCWGQWTWTPCRWLSPDNCQNQHFLTPTQLPSLLEVPNAVTLVDPCVIDSAGHVKCVAAEMHRSDTVEIPGLTGATSATPRCAAVSGHVSCWQVANKIATVTAVRGLEHVTQVVSGTAHDCALATSGQVSCWGANRAGELGDGTRITRPAPAPIPKLEGVVELAVGDRFTCARTKWNSVWCWGANEGGAIGDGSGRDQVSPVRVNLDGVVELRARGSHACGRLVNHHVACWGHWSDERTDSIPVERAVAVMEPETIEP